MDSDAKKKKTRMEKSGAPHQSQIYVKSLNAMANQQEVADRDQWTGPRKSQQHAMNKH